jgi:23S rRNA (guanine2535-N1)-methyltransferase
MEYRYTAERQNYEDFASGRVLYNQKGTTAFPVRLASELYQRGREILRSKGREQGYTLYDPCCGGGYLLAVLGFLHGNELDGILASDIDESTVRLAEKNLSLLTLTGLETRMQQLQGYSEEYGKASHQEALESAQRLKAMVEGHGRAIEIKCFQQDIFQRKEESDTLAADIVIVDVPYGNLVQWSETDNPMEQFLENIYYWIKPAGIIIVVSDKKQTIKHPLLRRLVHFKVGKRQVAILEPVKMNAQQGF